MSDIKTVKRNGLIISYSNEEEFERIYDDIFKQNQYTFKTSKNSPFILDCGSHIGLSILYFKKLYLKAKIVAFEPNPQTFELLKLNIKQNNLQDVKLLNVAISEKNGSATFYVEKEEEKTPKWTWGDSLVINKWYDPKKGGKTKVKTLKLSEFIKGPVDLIKLDVEGTEETVVREIEPRMKFVKNIFIEYHGSSTNPENNELKIIEILERSGFNVKISQDWKIISPEKIKRPDPYWLFIYAEKLI